MTTMDIVNLRLENFTKEMRKKLRQNEHKLDWRNYSISWLLARLEEEVEELKTSLINQDTNSVEEAADIANYAMMIGDILLLKAIPNAGPRQEMDLQE